MEEIDESYQEVDKNALQHCQEIHLALWNEKYQ